MEGVGGKELVLEVGNSKGLCGEDDISLVGGLKVPSNAADGTLAAADSM